MCASKRKACLHGARGQRLGSLHDCAWRRNQTFLAIIAALLRELSSDVVVGAERVGAVPLLHENVPTAGRGHRGPLERHIALWDV